MSKVIKIKKGLDIKLLGEAEAKVSTYNTQKFAVKPTDFIGVFPKLLVKEGDQVQAGTPLFYDKARESVKFASPVSGKVTDIVRGHKRVLLEVRIEADGQDSFVDYGKASPASMDREQIVGKMLEAGVWPVVRQRPYNVIANPEDKPKAVYISAFDTAPLAPDYKILFEGQGEAFQAGVDVLAKLTEGKIHLNLPQGQNADIFTNAKGVELTQFEGPHPAGNVGIQINQLDPINKGDVVWTLRPQEVIMIGRLFAEGRYNAEKVVALTGSEVEKPQYFKTINGATIAAMVKGNLTQTHVRYISGNVLTGSKIEKDGYVGFYDNQLTVIPEGDEYDFIGWLKPYHANKFSFYRSTLSWLTPNKKYKLDTNLNGGERAFVLTGEFEKVFPMDIYPMQLIKAIMIGDIDQMEALGIYEVDDEDFALCEYISTSKIEIQSIVRSGLDLMRKEMS